MVFEVLTTEGGWSLVFQWHRKIAWQWLHYRDTCLWSKLKIKVDHFWLTQWLLNHLKPFVYHHVLMIEAVGAYYISPEIATSPGTKIRLSEKLKKLGEKELWLFTFEILIQKIQNGCIGSDLIFLFCKAMSFIRKDHIFHRDTLGPYCFNHFIRFNLEDTGIVGTL